jgi:biopolymer transport protein ExbD
VPFDMLESEILKENANIADATIVLRIPHNLTIQDLVDVMQIGAKNKLKMVLATDKK